MQKIEYPENEKSFLGEIKSIFHKFWRAIIWWDIEIWQKIADTSFKFGEKSLGRMIRSKYVSLRLRNSGSLSI